MTTARPDGYSHDALFASSTEELLATVAPFLSEGLGAGEPAFVACSDAGNSAVRDELGEHELLHVLDRHSVYTDAVHAMQQIVALNDQHASGGGPRLRIVGEIEWGRDADEWAEWTRYEALCNHHLRDMRLWSICVYDTTAVPPEALTAGGITHTHLIEQTERRENPLYLDPAEVLRQHSHIPPEPLEATLPAVDLPGMEGVGVLRTAVRGALGEAGVEGKDAEEFVLAVNEVGSNAIRHGSPPVHARVWVDPDRLVCTVTDRGAGIDDPLLGYLPVHEDLARGGMGLWLARRLCDRVEISRADGAFRVRLTKLR